MPLLTRFSCLLLALFAWPAVAEPPTDCSTPRNAIDSVFAWQQPESNDLASAAKCLEPTGRSPAALQQMAQRVKGLFDARALFVRVHELPTQADYVNPETGKARIVVHPELPRVQVVRQPDGQWLWTADSLALVETLYDRQFALIDDAALNKLPKVLRNQVLGIELWQYLALFLLMLSSLLVRKVLQIVVLKRVAKFVESRGRGWGADLSKALESPFATLVMAGVLGLVYPQLHLPITASLAVAFAARLLATLALAWAAYNLVDVVSAALALRAQKSESKLDDQLVPLVQRTLKVITVVVGFLFVLQNMNVDVGSLLAGVGIGGLGLALAAKDTLANLFGSVMVFTDKPFQVGDWIVVEGVEGSVEEVGFRSTRIRTGYDSLVTLPNQVIANTKIDNYGARRRRRVSVTLNLTYDTSPEQLQAFCEGVRAIILANPHTHKAGYEIHFAGFGASSLDVMVYFFFAVQDWGLELRERHNVFLEILRLGKRLGVSFAFPTQTLQVEQLAAPGAARQVPEPLPPAQLGEVVRGFGPGGAHAMASTPFVAGGFLKAATVPDADEESSERRSA